MVYATLVERVTVAAGTMTVVVDVVGTVVVNATLTGEEAVIETVVVVAVGTSLMKTVDRVETESVLIVSVSVSNTVVT